MSPDRLRALFETSKMPPAEALRLSEDQAKALLPDLIKILDKAAEGVFLMPKQEQFLRHGLYALAAARCQELFQPLIRSLQCPYLDLDRVFGVWDGDGLTGIALSVFDGDVALLTDAIEDRTINGHVRWNLFDVFARLVFDGKISRKAALDLIDRFDDGCLAEEDGAAWEGWQDLVSLLGFEERADRVRASWTNDRNWRSQPDQDEWEDSLAQTLEKPEDPAQFIELDLCLIDDAVKALAVFHESVESETQTMGGVEDDLPEDPAAKIALSTDELAWLAGFFCSAQAPDMTMELEELDGFFTALIVGPATIPPSLYMPEVWGGDGEGPAYDSPEQADYVADLLIRHWNTISQRLEGVYPYMPFVEDETESSLGYLWAEGFGRGVGMAIEAWGPLLEDPVHAEMLIPIAALENDSELTISPDDLEKRNMLFAAALLAVQALYSYWHSKGTPIRSRTRKLGRNELCACGSGQKYKRCCGSPAVSMAIH